MFQTRKKSLQTSGADEKLLIEGMERIISGNYESLPLDAFHNQELASKFNQMLDAVKGKNNSFVMKLNSSMEFISNSECMMQMIEQLQHQDSHIEHMKDSSQELEASISTISQAMENIKSEAEDAYTASLDSVSNMGKSIQVVQNSSGQIADINEMMLLFQDKIQKINEIVDMVKKLASQSNLLALNASIEAARAGEAGKGFAIVADQVRELSTNTTASAEDIVTYVNEIQSSIGTLLNSVSSTASLLAQGTEIVQTSVEDIENVNGQMTNIKEQINGIYDSIRIQSEVADTFLSSVSELSDSYDVLSDGCVKTGEHIYRTSRSVDMIRSNMAREASDLSPIDWLRIYEIDHIIFTWRIYNFLAGYETLEAGQVNNVNGCKLGKWIGSMKDTRITSASAFNSLRKHHEEIHRCAVASFEAVQTNNRTKAFEHFQKVLATLEVLRKDLHEVRRLYRSLGETSETKYQ